MTETPRPIAQTTDTVDPFDSSQFQCELVSAPMFYRQWMLAGNPAYFFDRIANDFGDFVRYRGLFSFYLINHPTLVKQVLKETNKSFDKRSVIYDRFRNVFGDGLVVAEGERWKRQRKSMQPMFGPVTVRRFFSTMVGATHEMADQWESAYGTGTVFNIAGEMEHLTLKIAGQALFSDGFDDASEKIARWTSVINHYSAKPPLPIIRQFWFPSSINRKLKQTLREFHQFIHGLIVDRRKTVDNAGDEEDLLGILLRARDEDDGKPMTDEQIAEEVLGMIIGGHETSSSALTWLWYELHQHPEVETRMLEEIQRVVGDGPLSLEHVPQLTYTRMVIDECLRLHPPFWFENRNVTCDTTLGGHSLPKGALVVFSRYSLHRHPGFWKDAERFDPLRQDPDAPENSRSSHAQIPFGGGPRICVGLHFALLELVVVAVELVRRCRIVVDDSDRHEMSAQLTMAPKHGVRVRLEKRQL